MNNLTSKPIKALKRMTLTEVKHFTLTIVTLFKNLNLPNQIAILRAVSVIPISFLILLGGTFFMYIAFALFVIAAIRCASIPSR